MAVAGQVSACQEVLDQFQLKIPLIGLAKKREQIICQRNLVKRPEVSRQQGRLLTDKNYYVIELTQSRPSLLLLRQLRDESHRFTINYHHLLKQKHQTNSQLLEISQLGSVNHQRLMKHFGSIQKIKQAGLSDLERVVNKRLANNIYEFFHNQKQG